jgi:hypothetical protein
MPFWISDFCTSATSSWVALTPIDYARLGVLVVLLGWVLTRAKR